MSSPLANPNFEIALLGGGQLGKMLLAEALRMDVSVRALDPDPKAPCRLGLRRFEEGDFRDFDTVVRFARGAQSAVIEIETVNADALELLESEGVRCFPPSAALRIIQNKAAQKNFWLENGLPSSKFERFSGGASLRAAVAEGRWTLPLVWKLAEGGYDGFGVSVLRRPKDLEGLPEHPCVAEALVDIAEEIGVIVARHPDGSMATFPPVAMEFHPSANQVEFVVCPAPLPAEALAEAEKLARRAASALGILGLLAVELFYTRDGQWLINEVAPRPHNSGHLTIEGCETSQFEQLLRCATGLPLGFNGPAPTHRNGQRGRCRRSSWPSRLRGLGPRPYGTGNQASPLRKIRNTPLSQTGALDRRRQEPRRGSQPSCCRPQRTNRP